jgi:hypothetical protein
MANTPSKFGVGGWGVSCGGQSEVKVTEKEKWMEKKKTQIRQKKWLKKKPKKLVRLVLLASEL